MIELKNIDIGFAQKQCITDGSFCARDGQITVICGESGTGKSALLNLIAMLDQKNTCEYMYQGKLLQLSASEKALNGCTSGSLAPSSTKTIWRAMSKAKV